MAQFYKVDNRLLNEEEYNEHCIGIWAVCLFFAVAFFCGVQLHEIIPQDWAKEVRFAALLIPSILAGIIVAMFAKFIRGIFFIGVVLFIMVAVGMWIWNFA